MRLCSSNARLQFGTFLVRAGDTLPIRTQCATHMGRSKRKRLPPADKACKLSSMTRNTTGTMTELLRAALLAAPSLNAVEKATGVKRQSLAAFMRGEQVSIHLASADALAEYFGILCTMPTKPKRKGG